MIDQVTQYAGDVVSGRIVAGPFVRLACQRHLADLVHGPGRGIEWQPELAERVFLFFECLQLGDGEHAGRAFELEPAQKFIVGSLYGWVNALDGTRRFRTAYVEIGKGNGKTPLAAGLGLYALVGDGEYGAEVYSAAVSRDQAGIAYRDCARFVESSPALSRRLKVGKSNIAFPATSGYLRPVSSEGRGLDGKRVSMAIVDELHEHSSDVVVDKMRAGTKGRRGALILEITNSGYNRNSVCWEHHDYSIKVLRDVFKDDSWFAYVCALDEGDDWLNDPSCWIKANPLLGVSIPVQYLQEQVREAQGMPGKRNIVARLNFCVWTEQTTIWMPLDAWDQCASFIDETSLRGRPCFVGMDLATVSDLAALGYVFPPATPGEPWQFVVRLFCPADKIRQRARRDGVPYDRWAEEGYITATPGDVIDYAAIRQQLQRDAEIFLVKEIAYDRWNASHIVTELQGDGFDLVGFGQGFASMAAPMRELLKLVLGRECTHGGNPVLRWMASNISAKQDPAGNEKPDKASSGDKIDGIVALLMGLGRAMVSEVQKPSVYQTRGVLTL